MAQALDVLKFLGPHLLGMLKEAVDKWNDRVPDGQREEFISDYNRISGKLLHVPDNSGRIKLAVNEFKSHDPDARIFKSLHEITSQVLDKHFALISARLVVTILERDTANLLSAMTDAEKLSTGFDLSLSLATSPGLNKMSDIMDIKLIDDAILALARMRPERVIAPSGSLILRDIETIQHVGVNESDMGEIAMRFKFLYDIEVVKGWLIPTTVKFVPKSRVITEEVIQDIYGRSLANITMYEFAKLSDTSLPWYVSQDSNISVESVLDKICGSAITSLSTVIPDLISWMSLVYMKSRNIEPEKALQMARTSPWVCDIDTMMFVSPSLLFNHAKRTNTSSARLTEDFRTLGQLMELYRIFRSAYPTAKYETLRTSAPHRPLEVRKSPQLYPTPSAPSLEIMEYGVQENHDLFMLLGHSKTAATRLRELGAHEHADNVDNARRAVIERFGFKSASVDWP